MQSHRTGDSIAERHADLLANEFAGVPAELARHGHTWTSSVVGRTQLERDDGSRLSWLRWWGETPEIVLVHGGGLHAHSWDSVAAALAVPLIAIDLPGHGDSSWRDDADYSPAIMADAVLDTIRAVTDRPVALVGQSLGAMAALLVAHFAPQSVSSLTMVDMTPGRRGDAAASRNLVRFLTGPLQFGSYEEVIAHAIANGIGRDPAKLERGIILNTRRDDTGAIVFKHHFASLPPQPHSDLTHFWRNVEGVRAPLQLVRGTRGIVDDEQVAEFSRWRPDAAVHTLEAGHNLQRDAPEALAALIHAHAARDRSAPLPGRPSD